MKKLLFIIPALFLLASCGKEAEPPLSSLTSSEELIVKSVKLTKANSGLTSEDNLEAYEKSFDIEGSTEKYTFEIGPNCYAHSTYEEFLIKKNGYIKSKSNYKVDRLVIDYMSKKGINFEVSNSKEEKITEHQSTTPTEYPNEDDFGKVVEYPINDTSWTIKNITDYKPAFYSITVIFTMNKV